ncbi:hypothetical protein CRUP_032536 [Coryphaenoides rupestris]|nr:hypothetical protein CRUP_032536 [Coryphaenoides rupestris]
MFFLWLSQEKSNQEIDLTFRLKALQQSLEQEEAEHKATKAGLADKNKVYQSIEEAKSGAVKGERGQGERGLKQQVEGQLLLLEKQHSMLDHDYKQSQHDLEELRTHKHKLTEEVIAVTVRLEKEMQRRSVSQMELGVQSQQAATLRSSEKQLKQEINRLLGLKQSLDTLNQELRSEWWNCRILMITLYKTQIHEVKEERDERNKLYQEAQQSLEQYQEERESLASKLEASLTRADSEQLARSIARSSNSDLEKEKIMKELEIKDMMARNRQELPTRSHNALGEEEEEEEEQRPGGEGGGGVDGKCLMVLEESNRTLTVDVAKPGQ